MNIDELYSDLEPTMSRSWNRDVAVSKGVRSVKDSIIGLVMTRKGSRVFNPDIGCDISDSLFENITPLTATIMKQAIMDTIRNHEPRISSLSVETYSYYDDNMINVVISFSVIDSPDILEQIKLQLSH